MYLKSTIHLFVQSVGEEQRNRQENVATLRTLVTVSTDEVRKLAADEAPGERAANRAGPGAGDSVKLIRECRRVLLHGFLLAGVMSGFINVLQLTVPIFMLQVHDRVIVSQSSDTLKLLVLLGVGAITLYGILEFIRSITFQALSGQLISRLNLPAIEAGLTKVIIPYANKDDLVLEEHFQLLTDQLIVQTHRLPCWGSKRLE